MKVKDSSFNYILISINFGKDESILNKKILTIDIKIIFNIENIKDDDKIQNLDFNSIF